MECFIFLILVSTIFLPVISTEECYGSIATSHLGGYIVVSIKICKLLSTIKCHITTCCILASYEVDGCYIFCIFTSWHIIIFNFLYVLRFEVLYLPIVNFSTINIQRYISSKSLNSSFKSIDSYIRNHHVCKQVIAAEGMFYELLIRNNNYLIFFANKSITFDYNIV